jgi:hypothetical protein
MFGTDQMVWELQVTFPTMQSLGSWLDRGSAAMLGASDRPGAAPKRIDRGKSATSRQEPATRDLGISLIGSLPERLEGVELLDATASPLYRVYSFERHMEGTTSSTGSLAGTAETESEGPATSGEASSRS